MRRSGVRSPSAPPTGLLSSRAGNPRPRAARIAIRAEAGDLGGPMRIRKRHPTPAELGLTAEEGRVFRALITPQHIQEFVGGPHAHFQEGRACLASGARGLRPPPAPFITG